MSRSHSTTSSGHEIESVYNKYYKLLMKIASQKTFPDQYFRDLAEECIHETFLIAHQSFEILRKHPNPDAWIVRTFLNRFMPRVQQYRRREKHIAFSLDDNDPNHRQIPSKSMVSDLPYDEFMHHLLQSMTAEEQTIFTLYFLEDLTMAAIAKSQNISENHVRVLIRSIRRKAKSLRDVLSN